MKNTKEDFCLSEKGVFVEASNDYYYHDEDIKEFLRLLKEIKKIFSDIAITCPICEEPKRLWVKDENMCYDCKINKLAGSELTK